MVVSHPRMSVPPGHVPMQGGVFGAYLGRNGLISPPAADVALMTGFFTSLNSGMARSYAWG
jgi:hypothetical protein